MYAGRARLKTAIIEQGLPGGELLNTEMIEDYPGFEQITGLELARRMESHTRKFGAQILTERAVAIKRKDDLYYVETDSGNQVSKTLILSAGGSPVKLGIPGEKEFAGRGVSYCAVCDGAFFQDQVVVVVGGGDSAVEEANFLTRFASKVYVIHRRDRFRAQPILQERVFNNPKIDVIWDTVVDEVIGAEEVTGLKIRNVQTSEQKELSASGLFVFVGFSPNTWFVTDHVTHDQDGHLITNDRMETSMPGLFAAGDVRVQFVRQITTAVSDGTVAAIAAQKYIERTKKL
jgi:thioredoxin reductase (NADPH)